MTIFEIIKEFDEDKMAEFLLWFARDTIDQFSKFHMPSKEVIIEFLKQERPE